MQILRSLSREDKHRVCKLFLPFAIQVPAFADIYNFVISLGSSNEDLMAAREACISNRSYVGQYLLAMCVDVGTICCWDDLCSVLRESDASKRICSLIIVYNVLTAGKQEVPACIMKEALDIVKEPSYNERPVFYKDLEEQEDELLASYDDLIDALTKIGMS